MTKTIIIIIIIIEKLHGKMQTGVKGATPDLLRFVSSAYERPSLLFYGDCIIQSADVQQDDPLGLLLFCLSIHPLISTLKSNFVVFYLDDSTLGGSLQEVGTFRLKVSGRGSSQTWPSFKSWQVRAHPRDHTN